MSDRLVIPESIHAYTYLGEPVPYVPLKTPKREGPCPSCNKWFSSTNKGDKAKCPHCKMKVEIITFDRITMTETTTRHMRKYGLFPSISRLATYGEMDISLTNWYKNRFMEFVMDRYDPNRSEWVRKVQAEIVSFENEYADKGTEVHKWIQKFLRNEPVIDHPTINRCTHAIRIWCDEMEFAKTIHERACCNPVFGIGGTIDFLGVNGKLVSDDWKTKHNSKSFENIKKGNNRRYLWNYIKSTAGYREAYPDHIDEVYVSPINFETGETLFIKLTEEELAKGAKAMSANLQAWCCENDYYPQEMYKAGLCWSAEDIEKGEKA